MGWKTVKQYFDIKHIVHMKDDCLCIGSSYNTEIIKVTKDGNFIKRYTDDKWFMNNLDLIRYENDIERYSELFKQLIDAKDSFDDDIEVFTYDKDYNIIKKYCEKTGYPNITHDGELMYDGAFFTTEEELINHMIDELRRSTKFLQGRIADLLKSVSDSENEIKKNQCIIKELLIKT